MQPETPYPQVRYRRAALTTVVCQLRFHPILAITQAAPAELQERIRNDFPRFAQEHSVQFALALGQSPNPLIQSMPTPVSWKFETADEGWTVGLGPESLSLQTSKYGDFAEFLSRFAAVANAFHATYGVPGYTRVGLRYVNEFSGESFRGGWRARFQPWLLGPLSSDFHDHVHASQQLFSVSTGAGLLNVRHGLSDGGYRLDLDHAIEGEVGHEQLSSSLSALNEGSYQFFRKSMTDSFHTELEPTQ